MKKLFLSAPMCCLLLCSLTSFGQEVRTGQTNDVRWFDITHISRYNTVKENGQKMVYHTRYTIEADSILKGNEKQFVAGKNEVYWYPITRVDTLVNQKVVGSALPKKTVIMLKGRVVDGQDLYVDFKIYSYITRSQTGERTYLFNTYQGKAYDKDYADRFSMSFTYRKKPTQAK